MRIITSEEKPIGNISYFVQMQGDAPISVYVIHGSKGDMLVDTGFSSTLKPLKAWLSKNNFTITDIFLTHAHPDHDWNAAVLKELYNARIWLHTNDVSLIRNFAAQSQVPTSDKFTGRVRWVSFWTKMPLFKSKAYVPDVIFTGEDKDLPISYGYDAKIVDLPGHTLGSSGLLVDGVLYAGDSYTVLNEVPQIPPHVTSIELMNASIEKIRGLNPDFIACGHGLPFPSNEGLS